METTFKFGNKSKEILNTVDTRLQDLFNEVIKYYDCSIISGFRTLEEQQEMFKNKASKCDGINKISKHQKGIAIDVVPFPLDWDNINGFYELAGCVKTIAQQKGLNIQWGGDWKNFKDMPHWELEEYKS